MFPVYPARTPGNRPTVAHIEARRRDRGIVAMATAITAAVARGDLTPGEAQSLAVVIEAHRKTVELADLDRRLTELERQKGVRR